MAIQLRANDTLHILSALEAYRESLLNIPGDEPSPYIDSVVADVDRLLTSYRRSFKKLVEIGRW